MRRLCCLALAATLGLGAGCSDDAMGVASAVSLKLDVPNGILAPDPATSVEITIHSTNGGTTLVRSADIKARSFDLGDFPTQTGGWIEAKLRNQNGGLLGYGRSLSSAEFAAGGTIDVPVRRPIVYFGAGAVSFDRLPNSNKDWSAKPVALADLSQTRPMTGDQTLSTSTGYVVASGSEMFVLEQPLALSGIGSGKITVAELSSSNHSVGSALETSITGAVRDAVGVDAGGSMVVATSTGLWLLQLPTGVEPVVAAQLIAPGSFDRVAVIGNDATLQVYALSSRVKTVAGCATPAQLQLFARTPATNGWKQSLIAKGDISDLTSGGSRLFYVELCSGRVMEAIGEQTKEIRKTTARPVEVVSNDSQVWLASVTAQGVNIDVITLSNSAAAITLFSESLNRAFSTTVIPNIQRTVAADTIEISDLTLVGGEFLALTSYVTYAAPRQSNVVELEAETQRSWVVATSNGSAEVRYDSWCKEVEACLDRTRDICLWTCAATPGASRAIMANEHRVRSISAIFGRH
jgi:hypothetical protein